ncbi:MAG: DUF4391 domain-containing protein [Lentimicrobium sp.]
MEVFNLPSSAKVGKVIPKNAFESYTNTRLRKLLIDIIARITWLYKLSPETLNLEANEIKEIQIFKIELKVKEEIPAILDLVDKAIPYNIIFIIEKDEEIYLSTSVKHPHPLNDNNSVIDWRFRTDWFLPIENKYSLILKRSLDAVYHDFCNQLSGAPMNESKSLKDLVEYKQQIYTLEKEIEKLKTSIANCKQFNRKVELNLKMKERESDLMELFQRIHLGF